MLPEFCFKGPFIPLQLVKTPVKTLVKYKCYKAKCPACGNSGSLQLFINNNEQVTYARVRHSIPKGSKDYNANKKYNFTYCRIVNLETLKALLNGQAGQDPTANNIDPKHKHSSPKSEMAGPLGLEPRTFSLEG